MIIAGLSLIHAVGDVIGEPMLESLAGKEGSVVAENAVLGSQIEYVKCTSYIV